MNETLLEIYSTITTALTIILAVMAYRSGGPRLSARALAIKVEQSKYLSVEINNNGRGGVKVDILGVELFYFYSQNRIKKEFVKLAFEGPSLPLRLEGNSFERWQASADQVDRISNLQDPSTRWNVVLKAGGRRQRRIQVKFAKPETYRAVDLPT